MQQINDTLNPDTSTEPSDSSQSISMTPITPYQPRMSTRNRRAPSYLQDFVCQQATSLPHSQELDKDKGFATPGAPFPLCATLSYHKLSEPHKAFITSISTHREPNSYQEAVKCREWRDAMNAEIKALELNDT